jgi:hypothetical protein
MSEQPEGLRFLSGIILVSAEPARLAAFYRDVLGVPPAGAGGGDLVAHWSAR